MRSTRRITTVFGIILGLALIGIPQLAAAQAGAGFQDQGIREAIGDSVSGEMNANAHQSYAQQTDKPDRAPANKRPRAAANKHQREVAATQAHAAAPQTINASTNMSGLPGHSARPDGMCWTREFGSGHDLTGGYWTACAKH